MLQELCCLVCAPIAGTVLRLDVHTVGGVVTPAAELMPIVPDSDCLIVEATLPNKDAGFVAVGREVEIKVSALPFTRHGLLRGTVTHLARDATVAQSEDEQERAGYLVQASVDPEASDPGLAERVGFGMDVALEIKTDRRRVIAYLLDPYHDDAARGVAGAATRLPEYWERSSQTAPLSTPLNGTRVTSVEIKHPNPTTNKRHKKMNINSPTRTPRRRILLRVGILALAAALSITVAVFLIAGVTNKHEPLRQADNIAGFVRLAEFDETLFRNEFSRLVLMTDEDESSYPERFFKTIAFSVISHSDMQERAYQVLDSMATIADLDMKRDDHMPNFIIFVGAAPGLDSFETFAASVAPIPFRPDADVRWLYDDLRNRDSCHAFILSDDHEIDYVISYVPDRYVVLESESSNVILDKTKLCLVIAVMTGLGVDLPQS